MNKYEEQIGTELFECQMIIDCIDQYIGRMKKSNCHEVAIQRFEQLLEKWYQKEEELNKSSSNKGL